jgi:hypothetical protein
VTSSDEHAASLEHIRAGVRAWNVTCATLAPRILQLQPAPGVWSVKQNTWHLGDAFEATTIRLRAMLTQDDPRLLRFDADEWAAERDYQGRSWHAAIAHLHEHLGRLMALAEHIQPGQLARTGRQHNIAVNILGLPTESLTVLDLVKFEAAHVDEHAVSVHKIVEEFGRT